MSEKAPLVVTAPRFESTLAFSSVTAAFVSTVSVSAVITRPVFWVTAPLMSLTPIATVPFAAVMVPRATVEASRIVTTVPVPVEVMLPRRSMAEPWASIVAVPLPALMVVAVAWVTPTPVRAMAPDVVPTLPFTARAAKAVIVMSPLPSAVTACERVMPPAALLIEMSPLPPPVAIAPPVVIAPVAVITMSPEVIVFTPPVALPSWTAPMLLT